MKFGAMRVADAAGAVLAHTLRAGGRVLKKGRVLDAADVVALAAAGCDEIIAARLEDGDLGEDAAAAQIAAALAGENVRVDSAKTGRANLFAAAGGLMRVDAAAIAQANGIDEAITVATLSADAPVPAGAMVATVKIIPFAAPAATTARVRDAVRGAVTIRPWRARRVGLVLTRVADTADKILDRAAAAQRERIERCGGALVREVRVAHSAEAVCDAMTAMAADGLDLLLALGASAIMDRRDVIPAAVERAGGAIERLGMPVDPGNLLLLGRLGAATVIGVPGCARSTRRSGFDWVLERVCADLPITAADLAMLGVGGLLDEIETRPAPREEPAGAAARTIGAMILAAGRSTRMGANKLLVPLDGVPIIRHVVCAALASRARPVVVVTGNQRAEIEAAVAGLDVRLVHNPDFAAGMSTSLRVGIAALGDVEGALICLGDMPRVTAAHLDALVGAFDPSQGAAIVVPTFERKRGNPVLWARRYFGEMAGLTGDVGARSLLERHADDITFVAVEDAGVLVDVDTPESLAALT
jgi:molybdenum cofactor cytidylyltransferase